MLDLKAFLHHHSTINYFVVCQNYLHYSFLLHVAVLLNILMEVLYLH